MTNANGQPDPLQGSTREWPVTPCTVELRAILDAEPPATRACCIACLGGCTVQGGALAGARVGHGEYLAGETQFHLAVRLRRDFPGRPFVIRNFGEAGVTAGEFTERGGVEAMKAALPRIDVAFLRYGIADRKAEGIPKTIENIGALCERLEETFAGITIVIETDMWVDYPTHYIWDRNPRLAPLYDRVRELAAARGYPLVDIFANVEAETERGNWDLRGRVIPAGGEHKVRDDTFDAFFGDDPAYFTDVHPNARCLGLIAEWEIAKLRELFGDQLPNTHRADSSSDIGACP